MSNLSALLCMTVAMVASVLIATATNSNLLGCATLVVLLCIVLAIDAATKVLIEAIDRLTTEIKKP